MITGSGRQLIYRHIQEALLFFSRYKRGNGIPPLFRAYLDTLEEERAVENYVLGLKLLERKAVSMYLAGKRVEAIRGSRIFEDKGVSLNDIRVWIFGDREQFGLVNTMFGVFMRKASFCPFCHDQKRRGDGTYRERTHGSVCPHREMWEAEMMEGCDA